MIKCQVQSQEQMRLLHSAGVVQDVKALESGVAGKLCNVMIMHYKLIFNH